MRRAIFSGRRALDFRNLFDDPSARCDVALPSVSQLSVESVLVVTGSIFVLTLAALVVQIATSRFATTVEREKSRVENPCKGTCP